MRTLIATTVLVDRYPVLYSVTQYDSTLYHIVICNGIDKTEFDLPVTDLVTGALIQATIQNDGINRLLSIAA